MPSSSPPRAAGPMAPMRRCGSSPPRGSSLRAATARSRRWRSWPSAPTRTTGSPSACRDAPAPAGSRGRTASSGPRSTRGPSRCAGPERATTSLSSTPWASARMGPPAAPASPHWGARGCSSPCPRDPFSPAWPRTRTGFATGATAWGCWGATCSARRRPEAASRPVCSPRPWVSRRTSPTSTAPPASPPTWPARMPPRSPSTWATPSAPPTITAAAWRRETARLVRVGGAARIERVVRL
jgi:hypothetical protein